MSSVIKPIVTRKGSENTLTAQSGGAVRISGVSRQHTQEKPRQAVTSLEEKDAFTGERTTQSSPIWTEGDFVFVPPQVPHVEANMSTTEELVWLTCRSPDNIVVNLPEIEDSVLIGYRRR